MSVKHQTSDSMEIPVPNIMLFYTTSCVQIIILTFAAYVLYLMFVERLPVDEIKRKILNSMFPAPVHNHHITTAQLKEHLTRNLNQIHNTAETHSSPNIGRVLSSAPNAVKEPGPNESMPSMGNPLSSM